MPPLKPCPFCGCRDDEEQLIRRNPHDDSFTVICSCDAVGPEAGSRDAAVLRWNERQADEKLIEQIATFVENWGMTPPNRYGRRAQLAANIRNRLFEPKENDAAVVG